MTMYQIDSYLSQIPIVSTGFKLKEMAGAFMIKDFKQGQDFEEYSDKQAKEEAEFQKLQLAFIKAGVKPPQTRTKE